MRSNLLVTRADESQGIDILSELFKKKYLNVNASNALVVMVSPDYSASVAMHLAHGLSKDGEMCDILPIHVPFPDEPVDKYIIRAEMDLRKQLVFEEREYEHYVLVEAGVIRGGTYTWLTEVFNRVCTGSKVITVALYENIHSKFQSDIVMRYYDADEHDLTFYFEQENKHWT
jgi:hypothetical protein